VKSGDFVHVLAEGAEDRDVQEVLALRRYGADPVYFGPQLGVRWLILCVAIVIVSILSRTPWLMALPTLVLALHCEFLARRARIFARFSAELSDALAMASHELAPMPSESGAPLAVYSPESTSLSAEKGHGTR
jgi:Flp pilus assembly protein TadB